MITMQNIYIHFWIKDIRKLIILKMNIKFNPNDPFHNFQKANLFVEIS